MFGEPDKYRASLWLPCTTNGVVGLGGVHLEPEGAEEKLRTYTKLELTFKREPTTPNTVWTQKLNVAVVTGVDSGDVISYAPIPKDWFPPDHPRGKKT